MNKTLNTNDEDEELWLNSDEWAQLTDSDKLAYLHNALVELYLNIKFRNFEKVIFYCRIFI